MAFIQRNFLILAGFLLNMALTCPARGQGFVCDGRLFISLNVNQQTDGPIPVRNTEVYAINFGQGQVAFTDKVVFPNIDVNAVGYNPQDNLMYGVSYQLTVEGIKNVVRLYPDGSHEVLEQDDGAIQNVQWGFGGATFSPDGYYIVHDREAQLLHYLDVTGEKISLHASFPLRWAPEIVEAVGDFYVQMDDFAFDISDGTTIYSYQRDHDLDPREAEQTQGRVLKIDADLASPTVGTVSLVGEPDPGTVVHIGSMFFYFGGKLYGYASATSFRPNPPGINHERLVAIDKETGEIELIGTGRLARGNDGCSCPFALRVQMQAIASGDGCESTVRYDVVISNSFTSAITDVVLTDTLPDGMRISSVAISEDVVYEIAEGTGVGTSVLTLKNLSLPASTEVSFTIDVDARGLFGNLAHQAYLINLPAALGTKVASDDPSTDQPYDPTTVTITELVPRTLLTPDTIVCESKSLTLSAEIDPAWAAYWTDQGDFYSEEASPAVTPPLGQDSTYYYLYQQRGVCTLVDSVLVQVLASPQVTVISDTLITLGSSVPLVPDEDERADFSYQWVPSDGLSCSDCVNPIASPVVDTDYEVSVSNAAGCIQTAQVRVKVAERDSEPTPAPRGGVHLPNAFTPNADGLNDVFRPVANRQIVFQLLEIYNRWGERIYHEKDLSSTDQMSGWDGTYRGRRVEAGTYTYRLLATEEETSKEYRGQIQLIY